MKSLATIFPGYLREVGMGETSLDRIYTTYTSASSFPHLNQNPKKYCQNPNLHRTSTTVCSMSHVLSVFTAPKAFQVRPASAESITPALPALCRTNIEAHGAAQSFVGRRLDRILTLPVAAPQSTARRVHRAFDIEHID